MLRYTLDRQKRPLTKPSCACTACAWYALTRKAGKLLFWDRRTQATGHMGCCQGPWVSRRVIVVPSSAMLYSTGCCKWCFHPSQRTPNTRTYIYIHAQAHMRTHEIHDLLHYQAPWQAICLPSNPFFLYILVCRVCYPAVMMAAMHGHHHHVVAASEPAPLRPGR